VSAAGLLGRARGSPRLREAGRVGARIGAVLTMLSTAIAVGTAVFVALPLPPAMADPAPVAGVTLVDRHGAPLRTTRHVDGSRGRPVTLDEVDPQLVLAILAAEDHRFFDHRGVDGRAAARAAWANARSRRVVAGASTITMQTVRVLRPVPRSWRGKAAQSLWALRLERHKDKDWILEQYLNRVPMGQGAVGMGAAARLYLRTEPGALSLGQAALLAGLVRRPSLDNPMVSPARALERRELVLRRMVQLGFADAPAAALAAAEPALGMHGEPPFLAPHFTTWSLRRLPAAEATGTVRTTLDLGLQRALEAEVRHTVAGLEERGGRHAAVVVLENRTGDVLAWVGSPHFWADTVGQVDMVISRRQPGSTLKPFLYGLAFEQGHTAATVLPDVPRTYQTPTGAYSPQNYDRTFRGPVRARVALASSINVPAVELVEWMGVGRLLAVLRQAGFESLDREPSHYGLGLALGNGEVTLLELANAYRGLAAGGVWRPVRWRADSPVATTGRAFLQPGPATLVLDILADPLARVPGFGATTPFDFPFPAASKTGTSRHFTDNWAVATTGEFTVAAWVGDFTGRPMRAVSGVAGAGPLLHRAVLETARRYPPGHLPRPERVGAEPRPVCALSGLRPANGCATIVEWFLPGTEPNSPDHWERGGRVHLPLEYADWNARNGAAAGRPGLAGSSGARAHSDPPASPRRIVSPADGDLYAVPADVDARYATIPLVASQGDGVLWRVNGAPLPRGRWRLAAGEHRITAVWPDGARDSVTVRVAP
jgi:penicillin-binding protein 1C